MNTYLIAAIASAWSGMTVMNLSTDNQVRHLAAILFAIAVVLVIIGVAVNVRRAMDAGCETKSDEPKTPTSVQPHEETLQSPILPKNTNQSERAVLDAIRRKVTEYQDMGEVASGLEQEKKSGRNETVRRLFGSR